MLVCTACGYEEESPVGSSVAVLRPARGLSRLRFSDPFTRPLRAGRTMIPAPRTYALFAVAGTAMGAVVRHPVIGGALAVVLTWAFFWSSAIWGGRRHRADHRRGIPVEPEQQAEWVKPKFRSAPVPLYGVAGWSGVRGIDGWGGIDGDLEMFGLAHGDERTPSVSVTSYVRGSHLVPEPEELVHEVATTLEPPPESGDDDAYVLWSRRVERMEATLAPREGEVVLDGRPVAFDIVERGPVWSAVADLGDHFVEITARGLPPSQVTLETVRDLEPYL